MKTSELEKRVTVLEPEVAQLKAASSENGVPSWKKHFAMFANDPMLEEAMRLGCEYRESLRPKPAGKRRKGTRGAARHGSR